MAFRNYLKNSYCTNCGAKYPKKRYPNIVRCKDPKKIKCRNKIRHNARSSTARRLLNESGLVKRI